MMSYAVLSDHEIGNSLALGAQGRDIFKLVISRDSR